MDPKLRASGPPKTSWTYFGNSVQLPEPAGPQLFPRPNTIEAEIIVPDKGAQGVITCVGAFSAGWTLYIMNNKPVFKYNVFELSETKITSKTVLPKGKVTLSVQFTPEGTPEGSGHLKLLVNGQVVGEGVERSVFVMAWNLLKWDATLEHLWIRIISQKENFLLQELLAKLVLRSIHKGQIE
jgi:arylsulfatase